MAQAAFFEAILKFSTTNKKNTLILATMQAILKVIKDDGKEKPAIVEFHDFTKEGTNVVVQKKGYYIVKAKSLEWTVSGDNVLVMFSDELQ